MMVVLDFLNWRHQADLDWHYVQAQRGWDMPVAPWWKRLPVVRGWRARRILARVLQGKAEGRIVLESQAHAHWLAWGIARGFEKSPASARRASLEF